MKRWVIALAVLGVLVSGGVLFAQSEFSSGIKIFDDAPLTLGTDGDFQWTYDEATDNRLELTDGTNTLAHITDAGTTANMTLTGTMTANAFVGDGSGLTGLTVNPPIEDTTGIVYDVENNTRVARIRASNVPNSTTVDVEWPSSNLNLEPDVDLAAADALLTDIAALTAAKGSLIGDDGTDKVSLAVGADDLVLTARASESTGLAWRAPLAAFSSTKGTVLVANGTSYTALAPGTNDQVLIVDSSESAGVRWGTNAPSDGASNTLDNLDVGLVAVNTHLTPDTTASYDLGSASLRWHDAYLVRVRSGTGAGTTTTLQAYDVDGASWTTFLTLTSNNTPTGDLSSSVTIGGNTIANLGTAGVWTAQQNFGTATLTDGATINWNLATQQVATVTLGGSRTLANPTNRVNGGTYILIVKQDGTGSRTLGYGSAYKWPAGTAPVLTTTASATDIITFVSDGTNMFGVAVKNFS